jgi:hypothetical protein
VLGGEFKLDLAPGDILTADGLNVLQGDIEARIELMAVVKGRAPLREQKRWWGFDTQQAWIWRAEVD